MTTRTPSGSIDAVSLADLAGASRSSVVGVSAGPSSGSGWVALANGVIVTTHRVVGYQGDVLVEIEGGQRMVARVIAASVRRDLALVLPKDVLGLQALVPSSAPPRPGDEVVALRRLPGHGFGVGPGIAIACDQIVDGVPHLETDAARDPLARGGPLIDARGRLVGLVGVAPPRGRGRTGLVLPHKALLKELAPFNVPLGELRDKTPVYRCPACDEPFGAELDRCLACGALLPHAESGGGALAPAERVVRDVLATIGVVANKVRTGPRAWRLLHRAPGVAEATEVLVRIDEAGQQIFFRAPVVRVPSRNIEPLYRLLLTLNDETTGPYRLSTAGEVVFLSFVEAASRARERDAAAMLHDLVRLAQHYRAAITGPYGVEPLFEAPG